MLRKFPSIENSHQFAYAYDSSAWHHNESNPVEQKFRMYQTYGHDTCQHSADWPVTTDYLADYLNSLASAMLEDTELASEVYFTIWSKPRDKEIAFAASIIYKAPPEEKRYTAKKRYFSVKELKCTAGKEYDKRYTEVTDVHDGTSKSIFRILIPEFTDGLEKYCYAEAIRNWLLENDGWAEMPGVFLKWYDSTERARELRDAFEACKDITEAHRLKANVQRRLDNQRENREHKAESARKAAETAAAAEAQTTVPDEAQAS